MKAAAKTAKLMTALVDAEAGLTAARRTEARTRRAADTAARRVKAARARLAEGRRKLAAAEKAGKGTAAADRIVTARTARLDDLTAAAHTARDEATTARRAARAAERAYNRLARRAALSAARTVEKIARRLGESRLQTTPAEDKVLPADELPPVAEIEDHAARYADLDGRAKAFARAADAEKTWLRRLPVGIYGRVVVTRTRGRSILDGAQVELDYLNRFGTTAPRKLTRSTFKVDASALQPAQGALFVAAA